MPPSWNSKEKGLVKWQTRVCHRRIFVFRQTLSWPVHVKSVWHNDCLWISNLVVGNHSFCSKAGRMDSSDVDLSKGKSRSCVMELAIPLVTWAARLDTQVSCLQTWINHLTRPEGNSYPSSAALNCRIWFTCCEILDVIGGRTPGLWPTTWASAGESLLLQSASWVMVSWMTLPFSRLCCVQSFVLGYNG